MITNKIFITLIIFYGVCGIFKGFIRSVGGVAAMFVGGIIALITAAPITNLLFEITDLKIFLDNLFGDINGYISAIPGVNYISNFVEPFTICFIGIIIWTITAFFINTLVIEKIEKMFTVFPLGKPINYALGFVCGILKGIIITDVIIYAIMWINFIPGIHIPLNIDLESIVSSLFRTLTNNSLLMQQNLIL